MPVIMFSGHGTIETAVAAIKKGAYDFIEKPFKSDRLLHRDPARAWRRASCAARSLELRHLAFDETELIGNAPAMIRVRQAIERVAPTGSRIMISGPPGSGKEVAARLIHAKSRRASGPFVVLNAAALAPERVDIELFGAEPGWQGAGPAAHHRPARARRRRHAADRPGGRHAAGIAGQDPARAAGAALLAAGQRRPDRGRRAGDRLDQPRPQGARWRPASSARTSTTA